MAETILPLVIDGSSIASSNGLMSGILQYY